MARNTHHINSTADVTLVTTAETVVATLSGVNTGGKRDVALRGWAQVTTGVGTTALTPRIRRGTTVGGTLIGEANPEQVEAAAGSTEESSTEVTDAGVELGGASYVLTIQQTAATGNGTALQASLEASYDV